MAKEKGSEAEKKVLTSFEARRLIKMEKEIKSPKSFCYPVRQNQQSCGELIPKNGPSVKLTLYAKKHGNEENEKFSSMIIHPYLKDRLIALDMGKHIHRYFADGKFHQADSHLHVYTEEKGERNVIELKAIKEFAHQGDIYGTFIDFLDYCNIINRKDIDTQGELEIE